MKKTITLLSIALLFTAGRSQNSNTGSNGGFRVSKYLMEIPPGMVVVEGGIYTLPDEKNELRPDTISPFCISMYEETNFQYGQYLRFLKRFTTLDENMNALYEQALPDTELWFKEGLNEELATYLSKNYLWNPLFKNYPVLGLTTEQISRYALWKSDRINELILIREGILDYDTMPGDTAAVFSTRGYLNGTWLGMEKRRIADANAPNGERKVRIEDGIFLPNYRLPSVEEWKLAALDMGDEKYTYPTHKKEKAPRRWNNSWFGFLFVQEEKMGDDTIVPELSKLGLKPVNDESSNEKERNPSNYGMYKLESNASEFILSSTGALYTGTSWGNPVKTLHSTYFKDEKKWGYTLPGDPEFHNEEKGFRSMHVGFRLAMDYILYPKDQKLPFPRKKGKG
ncbi:MAG TPA: SUMF1/EgtB/PvdO family nonheme iron enzyme [Bacteroidia bacterium]